jgi:hypothetical protein
LLRERYKVILISSIGFEINSPPQALQYVSSVSTRDKGNLTAEKARLLKIEPAQAGLKQ